MSDKKVFIRTLYSSDTGKVYMVLNTCVIPELKQIPGVSNIEGVVLANMHTGDLITISYSTLYEKFKKIEEYSYVNQKGIKDIIKGRV